jgi:uncharacterized repeat protein (TIGR01451 family)
MTWHIEIIDSEGPVSHTSLALDGSNRPHIGYSQKYDDAMKHAWYDGTGWHIEIIDSNDNILYPSLALNANTDHPHISYHSGGDLKHARYNGTTWHIETVVSGASANGYTSLALDRAGWPHISYYDGTNRDLKYTQLKPSPSLTQRAIPKDGLRNNDTLTYTLTLSGPGLNVYLWDPLPNIVRYVPNSLTEAVTPTAVYSPTAHAISWRGTLPTNTVQTIQFQVTPGVTGTGSLDLSGPIVNTAWLTDTESGWSTSVTTIVNGWRLYLPLVLRP